MPTPPLFAIRCAAPLVLTLAGALLTAGRAEAGVACITNATTGACDCRSSAEACTTLSPVGTVSTTDAALRACCPTSLALDSYEALPEPNFTNCGNTVTFPANTIATVQPDGSLLVSEPGTGDVQALKPRKTVYTCSCDQGGGSCYPGWNGTEAFCVSQNCQRCTLNSRSVSKTAPLTFPTVSKGPAGRAELCSKLTVSDSGKAAAAVSSVLQWMAQNRIPMASIVGPDAIPQPGYTMRVQWVDGVGIAFPEPIGNAELAARPRKARCFCQGSGSCHWEGLTCVPNGWPSSCNGSCAVEVRSMTKD